MPEDTVVYQTLQGEVLDQSDWRMTRLTTEERQIVTFCETYARVGMKYFPGHRLIVLLARIVEILDEVW